MLFPDDRVTALTAMKDVAGTAIYECYRSMMVRVEQNDWNIYNTTASTTNYAYPRGWAAVDQAIAYRLTGTTDYLTQSYTFLELLYTSPDSDGRNLTSGGGSNLGLSMATCGLSYAICYDLLKDYWSGAQNTFISGKLNDSLNNWPSFSHANLTNSSRASNWNAACRGSELLQMVVADQVASRSARYTTITGYLSTHIANAYGSLGGDQEGLDYATYGMQFLLPAMIADSVRLGYDSDQYVAAKAKKWSTWYGKVFGGELYSYTDVGDTLTRYRYKTVGTGVDGPGFDQLGDVAMIFKLISDPTDLAKYMWLHRRYFGLDAPYDYMSRFQSDQYAKAYHLMFYPYDNEVELNPNRLEPCSIRDTQKDYMFSRNRWKDPDDTIIYFSARRESFGNSWSISEGTAFSILSQGVLFIGLSLKATVNTYATGFLVDGNMQGSDNRQLCTFEYFTSDVDTSYTILDGAAKYTTNLGLDSFKRHFAISYKLEFNPIISILDKARDAASHTYKWQVNVGDYGSDGINGITTSKGTENGRAYFLLTKNDSWLKCWVLNESITDSAITTGDMTSFPITGTNVDVWTVIVTGKGTPATANFSGSELTTVMTIFNTTITYSSGTDRIIIDTPLIKQKPVNRVIVL
jgi:hypothetical protein